MYKLKKISFQDWHLFRLKLLICACVILIYSLTVHADTVLLQQNFDASTNIPTGWARSTGSPNWSIANSLSSGKPYNSYPNSAMFYGTTGSSNRLYTLSSFDNTGGSDIALSFYMYHNSSYPTLNDNIQVQYSVDGTTWNNVGNQITRYSQAQGWVRHSVNIEGVNSSSIKIGFLGTNQGGGYIYIDDVTVTSIQSAISDLKQIESTQNTITLSFSKPTSATGITLNISEDGSNWIPATMAENLDANSTSAKIINLQSDKVYYFRLDVTGGSKEGTSNIIQAATDSFGSPSANFEFDTVTGSITKYLGNANVVVIPNKVFGVSVTKISDNAFQYCKSINSVTFPSSINNIGNSAFQYCTNLNDVCFDGNAPTTIGSYCFDKVADNFIISFNPIATGFTTPLWNYYPCVVMSSISNLMQIAATADSATFAFSCPHSANNVILEYSTNGADWQTATTTEPLNSNSTNTTATGLQLNKDYMFRLIVEGEKREGTSNIIHGATDSIGNPSADFIFDSLTGTLTSYIGTSANVVIPSKIFGVDVKSIGDSAFSSNIQLISVIVPDKVTMILKNAFWCCTSLNSIDMPNSILSIGNDAFGYCTNLKDIRLPDSVELIGSYAFEHCISIENIVLPSNIKTLCGYAFSNCSNLKSIDIPNGITDLYGYTFEKCTNLEIINISDNVKSINSETFNNCTKLCNINISTNNQTFSSYDGAIYNKSMTTIYKCPQGKTGTYIIPYGVVNINKDTFKFCRSLNEVVIPASVTNIGSYAFGFCSGITKLVIPESVTTIDICAFWGCSGLQTIRIPSSIVGIADYAFQDCTSLTSIAFPSTLSRIGYCSFLRTNLKNVYIPQSVTSIDGLAFSGCSSLVSVFFEGNAPNYFVQTAFKNANASLVVYCKQGVNGFLTPNWNGYSCEILSAPYFSASNDQNLLVIQNGIINGNLSATIKNSTNADKYADMLLIIYSNNKILKTIKQSVILIAGENIISFNNVNVENTIEDNYKFKLMVLDRISDVKPLTPAIEGLIH